MTNNTKFENEKLKTTIDLGYVYANFEEGEKEGEIVEAGFTKEMRLNRKTGNKSELPICICKLQFTDEKGNQTFLQYKAIVSRAEHSRFIVLLKEFNVSFADGKVDVGAVVGEKVIATIKNNDGEHGRIFSNVDSIRRIT